MKEFTPEEKADRTLESLESLRSAEVPPGLEAKLLARFDMEFAVRSAPKWFWAAAVLLLAINIAAAVKFTRASGSSNDELQQVAGYYFPSGSLYQ